jgi:hypothetical protein
MAKKVVDLDTPFRKGEQVVATRDLDAINAGTRGKIMLQNGIGPWRRYWVLFDGDRQVGQIDHDDLVRPKMLQAWMDRKEELERAAELAESTAAAAVEAGDAAGGGGGGGGIADQIPAHLLERSRAAKARLLG